MLKERADLIRHPLQGPQCTNDSVLGEKDCSFAIEDLLNGFHTDGFKGLVIKFPAVKFSFAFHTNNIIGFTFEGFNNSINRGNVS